MSCLLSRGLDADVHDGQTLDDLFDQIDIPATPTSAYDHQMPENQTPATVKWRQIG